MDYNKLYHEAQMVAFLAHKNQTYDIFPYEKHILDVVAIIKRFGYSGDDVCASYLHDVIEDAALTYNKIFKAFGFNVAEIVLACTDPSDIRNRREKKARVYEKIRAYPNAVPTKVADRIANLEHSVRMENLDKVEMYVKESGVFEKNIRTGGEHDILWNYLNEATNKGRALLETQLSTKVKTTI